MTKRLLTDMEYTIVDINTITIDSTISFTAENLNLIIDTADNRIVYNFACEDLRATVSGQTITLIDTTIDTSDSLTIIMSFEEGSEIAKLEENISWNKKIQDALTSMIELQTETNKILKKISNPE
jgi:hypothetical protein